MELRFSIGLQITGSGPGWAKGGLKKGCILEDPPKPIASGLIHFTPHPGTTMTSPSSLPRKCSDMDKRQKILKLKGRHKTGKL